MTKEILANRGRMNDDLRMSEGELSSLISSSGDDDHSCRPSSEMSFLSSTKNYNKVKNTTIDLNL